MTTLHAVENEILLTSTGRAANDWDELLRLQTNAFLPYELEFFLSNSSWAPARSVLDVGCGNGFYLSQLQPFFPRKSYLGIDVSAELIGLAAASAANDRIAFEQADFFSFRADEPFDVVLMRLIVQHLSGFDSILEQASLLLRPGGALIVIEPDIENSRTYPQTPIFDRVVRDFEKHRDLSDRNRKRLGELAGVVARYPDWRLARELRLSVPTVGPFVGTAHLRMMSLWIDLMERSGCLSLFDAAREELACWSKNPASFSQVGIRILQLKHVDAQHQIH
ncbi:MAG: class I SAM-dependent methyltransferase [Methyloligellaceae bacterium]